LRGAVENLDAIFFGGGGGRTDGHRGGKRNGGLPKLRWERWVLAVMAEKGEREGYLMLGVGGGGDKREEQGGVSNFSR
jgi:hypothetical protein